MSLRHMCGHVVPHDFCRQNYWQRCVSNKAWLALARYCLSIDTRASHNVSLLGYSSCDGLPNVPSHGKQKKSREQAQSCLYIVCDALETDF